MNEDELRERLRELFLTQRLAVLSTNNLGQPYTSLVAFSASRNLTRICFATNRSTRKYANLLREPRISLLMDNRSNSSADLQEAMAVTVTGVARDIEEDEADLKREYLEKHPSLEAFVASPGCALVTVEVALYQAVHRFQDVVELRIGP